MLEIIYLISDVRNYLFDLKCQFPRDLCSLQIKWSHLYNKWNTRR